MYFSHTVCVVYFCCAMAGTFPGAGRREGRLTRLVPGRNILGVTIMPDGPAPLLGVELLVTVDSRLRPSITGCDVAWLDEGP